MLDHPRLRLVLAWAPVTLYMTLIWILSSISMAPSFDEVPFHDKGVHFMEYGVLAAFGIHALYGTWPQKRMLWAFMLAVPTAVLWGLIDEIHQAFVPLRVADVKDLAADSIGVVIGGVCYALLRLRVDRWMLGRASRE